MTGEDGRLSIEGKSVAEVIPPEFYTFWEPYYRAAFSGQETALEQKIGDHTYFCQILPVKDEHDHIFAGMGVVQDITEFKETEAALREMNEVLEQKIEDRTADLKAMNEELSMVTYIIAHDLRSPLVNLKGFAKELRSAVENLCANLIDTHPSDHEQAARDAVDKDILEALSFIEFAVTRMDHLTNVISTLSRMGRRELNFERIDMNGLTEAVLNSMAHQIKQQGVTVAVDPLPEVQADRIAMEQIMGNILNNAVIYLSPHRPGDIRVWGEATTAEKIFHIVDNGRGIAEEDSHKVFELFRRAGIHDVPGDGLGLAYVQILVRRHAGRIWFKSTLDVGSTFSFSIPHSLPR